MTTTSAPSTSILPVKFASSAFLSTSASRAAAWTWDHPPSASPVSRPASKLSDTRSKTAATSLVAIPEQKEGRRRERKIFERDHRDLHQARGTRPENARSREGSARARRRSLHGGRYGLRRGRVLPQAEPAHRPDLDRRPHRHQHAGFLAQRQRARHAPGCALWGFGLEISPTFTTSHRR